MKPELIDLVFCAILLILAGIYIVHQKRLITELTKYQQDLNSQVFDSVHIQILNHIIGYCVGDDVQDYETAAKCEKLIREIREMQKKIRKHHVNYTFTIEVPDLDKYKDALDNLKGRSDK